MKNSNEKFNFNFVTVCVITGAFIAYAVGSGFASGNEVLQFFGSWGLKKSSLVFIGAGLITLITCICLYRIGSVRTFATTSAAYEYVGGKGLGKFFQIWTFVSIFGTFMIMFSGAGSLFNQYWGLPQWVGSALMGLVSGIIVIGGLKTVERVLGSVGIILLVYVVLFGIISLFHPACDLAQADNMAEYVESGVVYQANLFALPPLSWIPGLASINNPMLEGMLYAALVVVNGVPFFLTLGKRTKTMNQAVISGVATTVALYLCTFFVMILILSNFNEVVNTANGKMSPFPVLAALDVLWPSGSWTYVIIIFGGIFTTTTGFLWVLSAWLFPGESGTKKTNTFVIVMVLAGLFLGSVLPFSALINFLFPLSGLVGIVLTVCLVVRLIQTQKAIKSGELKEQEVNPPEAE